MSENESLFTQVKGFFKNRQKTIRFCLIILLASLVALIACSTLVKVKTGEAVSSHSMNNSSIVPFGYERVDSVFKPTSNDPQIHFIPVSADINDVTVRLAEPVEKDVICQLFFAYDNVGFSESNSIRALLSKGQSEIFFTLPTRTYSLIRIDIDGTFVLDEITLSNIDNASVHSRLDLNVGAFVVLILLISALASLYLVFEKRSNECFLKIKNNFFSYDTPSTDFESKRGCRLSKIYLIIASISSVALIFLIPPLTVADEVSHFANVLKVSHFEFLPTIQDNKIGAMLYENEIAFLNAYNSAKPTVVWSELLSYSFISSHYATDFFASSLLSLNPLSYIVSGGGLGIIRLIFPTLDVYSCLVASRLINAVFATLVTAYAIKTTPVLKNTMLLLALMPMTLYQCASVSYDATLIPMSFLFFAIAMRLIVADPSYRITIKDVVSVCVCVFFLVSVKIAYAVVVIVLLAVSIKKFGSMKKYVLCISVVLAIGALFYILPTALISGVTSQAVSTPSSETIAHKEAFYANLNMFPTIVSDTVDFFGGGWKAQFFGVLGWLTVPLPALFRELFFVLLSITLLIDACQIKKLSIRARLLSLIAFSALFIGTVFEAYASWNPSFGIIGGTVAYGIQGRYFIPIILFLMVIIANPLLTKFKYTRQINTVTEKALMISGSCFAFLTVFAVLTHYWL